MSKQVNRTSAAGALLALAVTIVVSGCTQYRSVDKAPDQTWLDARRAAAIAAAIDAPVPQSYRVRPGDNLARVAKLHGTTSRTLIVDNALKPPFKLREGQILRVPSRPKEPSAPAAVEPVTVVAALPTATVSAVSQPEPARQAALPVEADPELTRQAQQAKPPALSGDGFLWPLRGSILSSFGDKPNGQRNEGINLAAAKGAPIRAAEHGIVVHAGETIPGYGRMLLIRHADGFTTMYAHANAFGVQVGDQVARGQVVAWAGDSGDVKVPQVHFELRVGTKAIDPKDHMVDTKTQIASR